MKKFLRYSIISSVSAMLLIGCGGGGSSSSSSTAIFKDSGVDGLTYTCGSTTGITQNGGEFKYSSDNCTEVIFSIGNIKLGSINVKDITDGVVYPTDLTTFDRTDTTQTSDGQLKKLLQLLQTLDSDENPNNGLSISDETRTLLENISELDIFNSNITTNEIESAIGKTLLNENYAVAHYEETLREDLGLDIDTVAPAPAVILTEISNTNKNSVSIKINGETGALVFVNGTDTGIVIDENNEATIDLNTSGADGKKSFDITLKDTKNNLGDKVNKIITKDTISPAVAIHSAISTVVNTDSVTTSISGEDGSDVYVNGVKVGTIANGSLEVTLDTSGKDGEKAFSIMLKDKAENESGTLDLSILKDTSAPVVATAPNTANAVNSDSSKTTVFGEDGTDVYVNGIKVGTIANGSLEVNLDTSGNDETKTFLVTLKDSAGNESTALNLSIVKDTIAPIAPKVSTKTALVNGKLSTTISGEIGTKVYINEIEYGTIGNLGNLEVLVEDPNNSYYETLKIKLEDAAGNISSITKYITTFSRIKLDTDTTYFIPENISVLRNSSTNEEAIITSYESDEAVGGAVARILIGVNTAVSDKLSEIINLIAANSNISTPVKLIEQVSSTSDLEKILAEYTITSSTSVGTIDLISQIVNSIMGGNLSNLPSSSSSSISETYFNIRFNLEKDVKTGESYLTIALVPNNVSLNYQSVLGSLINIENISDNNEIIYNNVELFKASPASNKTADFVFVVDDSGSMASYQNAVSQAANDFASAITNAGLDFRVGIITTSCGIISGEYCNSNYKYDRVLNSIGIIQNDIASFKNNIIVGTNGDSTETGIFNAEYSLQSTAFSDSINGPLTNLNMPKGSDLSVIILSDEQSQYYRRAYSSFDVNNNLFIDRGYRVYSIVNTASWLSNKQYNELALASGGMVAEISNTGNYSTIMNTIAQVATGNLGYKLTAENIIESTIYVMVNGVEVPRDNYNGWRYIENSNSILFYGTAIPKDGYDIRIQYSYKN